MRFLIFLWMICFPLWNALANGTTVNHTIVVLGDSLVAGYGLPPEKAFPEQLGGHLKKDYPGVTVINAGVSGDTTAGGKARLATVLNNKPDIVIVVLGGNDVLRGIPPEETRANLDVIIKTLTEQHIKVVLAGFSAPPNYGKEYADGFNPIYPELAKRYGTALYPFFLDGVYGKPELNLNDGIHPTAKGIEVIVEKIAPYVRGVLDTGS